MNQKIDAAPAVVLKGMADFDTTEAWEEDLIKRVTDHLSWVVNHPSYESKYEVDQDVDLRQYDSEKIDALLFGQFDDSDDNSSNWEYLTDLDEEVIKEEAGSVFDLFEAEIEALADATDRESEELKDQWLESDEFSPSGMQCNLHYNNYRYTNEVAANSELPFNLTLDPVGDDLWSSLAFFRINAADFLLAAQRDIEDLTADSEGKITEDVIDALAPWAFTLDDIQESVEGEDPIEQNAVLMYTSHFLMRQAQVEAGSLSSCNQWPPGDSALAPNALFAFVKEHSYSKDINITTYLQMCLDGNTVSTFSERCKRHDSYDHLLPVTVLTGYLTKDSDPGYLKDYVGTVMLSKPVTVSLGAITIDQKNSPESGGSDTLLLPPNLDLYEDLYEILVLKRKDRSILDLADMADAKAIEQALALLEGKSQFLVASALSQGDLLGFKPFAQEFMARGASMFDQDEFDRTLVAKLEALAPGAILRSESKEIELLIDMGARGDFVNTLGANALHLAAKRSVPLPLLNAIAHATDQLHLEIQGQGNAFNLGIQARSYKGIPDNPAAKEEFTSLLSWFLDQGIGLTPKALEYPKPGVLTALERLDDGRMITAAIGHLVDVAPAEEIQRVKDKMFYNAAMKTRDVLAAHLVSAGARVDAVSRALAEPCSIEEAIDKYATKAAWDKTFPERAESIKAMARSSRLRNSALSLIDEMENDAPALAGMRP